MRPRRMEPCATVGGVSVVTFSGGLAAHARPFVVGQSVTCSGCTPQAIAAVSLPPTQSTRTGEGQIGQSFTITLAGSLGVTGSKAITAGCSGTAGTSANCIDIAFTINTTAGTFGTAAALATCGANNLNGNAPNYAAPAGVCQDNGVGRTHPRLSHRHGAGDGRHCAYLPDGFGF